MESDFADRFYWARMRADKGEPMGSLTLSKKVGCSPSMISNIEIRGSKGSRLNDKFAKMFGVDPGWLRDGSGPVPKGFNAEEARAGRLRGGGARGAHVVHLKDYQAGEGPRWADAQQSDAERADALQSRIMSDFQDFARLTGGTEAAVALVDILGRIAALTQARIEKPKRDSE